MYIITAELFLVISIMYANDPVTCLALKASISVGYGASLRPQEYLSCPGTTVPLSHQLSTTGSTFWWGDNFWYVYDLSGCPPLDEVTNFASILDFNKNHPLGDGTPRCISRAPPGSPFCMVRILLEYFVKFPATIHTPLLSSHGPRITSALINRLLKLVASKLDLPLHNLSPASLRSGGPNQLSGFTEEHRCMQGSWKTISGMRAYMRQYLSHSDSSSAALHNPSLVTLTHLQYTHSTQPSL